MYTFIPIQHAPNVHMKTNRTNIMCKRPDVLDLWGGDQAEVETVYRNVMICAFSINATREACV
jgi:hypothetical protein